MSRLRFSEFSTFAHPWHFRYRGRTGVSRVWCGFGDGGGQVLGGMEWWDGSYMFVAYLPVSER